MLEVRNGKSSGFTRLKILLCQTAKLSRERQTETEELRFGGDIYKEVLIIMESWSLQMKNTSEDQKLS